MRAVINHYDNSGVSYWRLWIQAKYLERRGWDVYRFDDNKPFITVEDWEKILPGTDIFINQGLDNPEFLALTMAMRDEYKMPIVVDIDDDMYDISPSSPAYQHYYPGSPVVELAEEYIRDADLITTTTDTLAELYSGLNNNIKVLPNVVDPEDWPDSKPTNGDPIILGWVGSPTHYDDLKLLKRPIAQILRKNKNVKLRVMGCLPDFWAGHPQIELRNDYAEIRDWPKTMAKLNIDIGLAPLVTRPFNLGKSNLKWIEYSALQIPGVYSNMGEYKKTIVHNETGLVSNSDLEWEYNIQKLIDNESLRKSIGKQAKQKVLKDFNIVSRIKDWEDVYRSAINTFATAK